MTDIDPQLLSRIIAVINGKGGVGKTSIVANLGAQLAEAGYHVLLASIDPQDNLGEDLAYANRGDSDDGQALVHAIDTGEPLQVLKNVRENLDVIPGGDYLEGLNGRLYIDTDQGIDRSQDLARVLATVSPDYDVILLDCPPGYHNLQHLALVAARWMLVPTATDASSRKGLSRLAERVMAAAPYNPQLALLGVVLFDIPVGATRVKDAALRAIRDDLGADAPLFTSTIRTARAAAFDARERGQVMHELSRDVIAAGPFWKRDKKSGPALARSAQSVAGDYEVMNTELMQALVDAEATEGVTS